MTTQECRDQVYQLKQTADINQRYHQRMEWRWGVGDKSLRILVGLLAAASVVLGLVGADWAAVSVGVSCAGLGAAIALNVIPTGEREKFHGELFHCWSGLRGEAVALEGKLARRESAKGAGEYAVERMGDLWAKCSQICATEPAPYRRLLRKCQHDSNESEWGDGIRTEQQVERERSRRLASPSSAEAPRELASPAGTAAAG